MAESLVAAVKPEFTLIYDDLSWEARDLRLAVPVERRGLHFEPDLKPYKYAQQSIADRDIRRRFGYAIDDFVRIVSGMKVGEVYHDLSFKRLAIPYKVKLLPMSKFLEMHKHGDPKALHLTLPMNPIFLSFHFADIAIEKYDQVSVGLYSSPETIALIKEWQTRALGTNSTFMADPELMDYLKDLSRISSLALIKTDVFELSDQQLQFAHDLAKDWLDAEFSVIQQALAAKLGQEEVQRVTTHNDVFFADAKDDRCEQFNLAAIANIAYMSESEVYPRQRNVTEADTLRQVITLGLAGDPTSSDWSKFLAKGLYDPRLFLHVWDMINHKEEPD